MTLLDDVQRLQRKSSDLEEKVEGLEKTVEVMQEKIGGERGLSAAIKQLAEEVGTLRKSAWWLAGIIITASIAFAFGVMQI